MFQFSSFFVPAMLVKGDNFALDFLEFTVFGSRFGVGTSVRQRDAISA